MVAISQLRVFEEAGGHTTTSERAAGRQGEGVVGNAGRQRPSQIDRRAAAPRGTHVAPTMPEIRRRRLMMGRYLVSPHRRLATVAGTPLSSGGRWSSSSTPASVRHSDSGFVAEQQARRGGRHERHERRRPVCCAHSSVTHVPWEVTWLRLTMLTCRKGEGGPLGPAGQIEAHRATDRQTAGSPMGKPPHRSRAAKTATPTSTR